MVVDSAASVIAVAEILRRAQIEGVPILDVVGSEEICLDRKRTLWLYILLEDRIPDDCLGNVYRINKHAVISVGGYVVPFEGERIDLPLEKDMKLDFG